MKVATNLKDILGKRIESYSIQITCNSMFETITLTCDDNTSIEILTPTRSEITERTKMSIANSILSKGKIKINPLDHE